MAPQIAAYAFSAIPLLAVAFAIPFAWGWGLGWTECADVDAGTRRARAFPAVTVDHGCARAMMPGRSAVV